MSASTLSSTGLRPEARTWQDGKRYLWPLALVVPVLPYVGFGLWHRFDNALAWYLTPFLVYVIVPVGDWLIGEDAGNPPAEREAQLQSAWYYRVLTFLYLPLQFGSLVLGAWCWSRPHVNLASRVGMVVTIGIVTGIAINTAHELGHKREDVERWLSKIALAPSGYGHFYVEHNRGHHVRVATPEDPASSRLGESFYRFWPRTVWGSLKSAWALETKKHRLRNRSPWTVRNDLLNAWLMTVVVFAGLTAWLGVGVLPFLLLQMVFGFSLLEIVNYLEHYGLLRQRTESGRYEKVEPVHSWNSDRLSTNVFLYQLQRHSDHHAYPNRRYQVLRSFDEAPQLPGGYATMIVVALFPPVWRRVMDQRVLDHYDGDPLLANLTPKLRAKYEAQAAAGASGS
ncbi:alkane 1-monooxygenase [Catenulispora sp. MAP12-49]|uniref:alkane 1-monooxygenase n=1 Tax=unclassified Catenulispora TaxID=414885 RepID=UPI003510EE63